VERIRGRGWLLMGINVAYGEDETRGFFARRWLALLLTVGAIVFAILVVALLAVLPAVLDGLGLGSLAQTVLTVGRWPLLAVLVMAGLAVLYRYAPTAAGPGLLGSAQARWSRPCCSWRVPAR
jgi:membrane protein